MLIVQNSKLLDLMRHTYTTEDLQQLIAFLDSRATFDFHTLSTGLFSAAITREETQYTGYKAVWVRDNIHIAHAHYVLGDNGVATRNVASLLKYFKIHKRRFERIIDSPGIAEIIMERPHVRFDGENLNEINEKWAHAQNDALGYFLWFCCTLLNDGLMEMAHDDAEVLALFPLYFNAISYWKDADSGHWEEERKVEASSIGVVLAGLDALRQLLTKTPAILNRLAYKNRPVTIDLLNELIDNGRRALYEILPYECRQPSSRLRKYDSALLFLIYPLRVVDDTAAEHIVEDVINHLQGPYGIRRYSKDSFWAADYKKKLSPEQRTTDVSDDMTFRDSLITEGQEAQWCVFDPIVSALGFLTFRDSLITEGQEAQWCVFDPIVSAIFGLKFRKTRQRKYLEQQTVYLNRSLGQLTGEDCEAGEFKCPELYYLSDNNYIPNDATPLLWSQANLRIALKKMEDSLQESSVPD